MFVCFPLMALLSSSDGRHVFTASPKQKKKTTTEGKVRVVICHLRLARKYFLNPFLFSFSLSFEFCQRIECIEQLARVITFPSIITLAFDAFCVARLSKAAAAPQGVPRNSSYIPIATAEIIFVFRVYSSSSVSISSQKNRGRNGWY